MVKGVATVEDAKMCIDHGVQVLWVSNHGGRQLDQGLGAMDVLPDIVNVAVRREPTSSSTAACSEAPTCSRLSRWAPKRWRSGKLQAWGLGADGKDGCLRMLEILENEIISAMGLLGVTSIDQLSPQVRDARRRRDVAARDERLGQYA